MLYLGLEPTPEEWKKWCKKNKDLWIETDKWIEEYKKDPYVILTKMLKRMDKK